MRRVTVQTLLVHRARIARTGAVVEIDVLMAFEARLRLHGGVAMRLVAVEAGLIRMHDDGGVRALCIVVAIQALVTGAEEHIRRRGSELQASDAQLGCIGVE